MLALEFGPVQNLPKGIGVVSGAGVVGTGVLGIGVEGTEVVETINQFYVKN